MRIKRSLLSCYHRLFEASCLLPSFLFLLDFLAHFTLAVRGNTLISGFYMTLHMVSYRTSVRIVADLLTATEQSGQEGIKTTSLLTKANLSHSRLSKFLENLTGAGLINKIEFDGKNTFVITSKGRQYLDSYVKFSSIAESFGLEL